MGVTRDQILDFQDAVIESVFVKEWSVDVCVRSLSAADKAKWELNPIDVNMNARNGQSQTQLQKARMESARQRLVELAACNEDGSRLFKDGDAAAIGKKNANAIETLYDVAARLSGIGQEQLEDAVKNSEAGTFDEDVSA